MVPDLCPRCGAYWECECGERSMEWQPNIPDTFTVTDVSTGEVHGSAPQGLLEDVARLREEGRELRHGIEKKMQELQGTEPPCAT